MCRLARPVTCLCHMSLTSLSHVSSGLSCHMSLTSLLHVCTFVTEDGEAGCVTGWAHASASSIPCICLLYHASAQPSPHHTSLSYTRESEDSRHTAPLPLLAHVSAYNPSYAPDVVQREVYAACCGMLVWYMLRRKQVRQSSVPHHYTSLRRWDRAPR